jgi:putative addiction module CopG family antidote
MDVKLIPELETYLHSTVQSGHFNSTEEALNKAVQLLKDREEAEAELEAMLQEAEDSGPAAEMTKQDWADIEKEGLKKLDPASPTSCRWLALSDALPPNAI